MRIIVFFDLPVDTAKNRHDYNNFRKFLIKNGYMMMQESVYCRLEVNKNSADASIEYLKANKPPVGLVQILTVTEKQFAAMETIVGKKTTDIVNDTKRLVEL